MGKARILVSGKQYLMDSYYDHHGSCRRYDRQHQVEHERNKWVLRNDGGAQSQQWTLVWNNQGHTRIQDR